MITELTTEQVAQLEEIKNKWIAVGMTHTPITNAEIEDICRKFHKRIHNTDETRPIIVMSSPYSCWKAVEWILQNPEKDPSDVLKADLSTVKHTTKFIWPYNDGNFLVSYFAWVESMEKIGVTNLPEWRTWANMSKIGLYYPLKTAVVVGTTPVAIHRNSENRLHHETEMAVRYSDGWGVWALNGVRMKKHHIVTPAEELTSEAVLTEKNVEVRRELIRKMGIDRLLEKLPHKKMDTKGNYELFSVELSEEVKDARYLKMTNPSIGVFHVEGVAPECSTVDEALAWRNSSMFVNADVLT